MSRFSALSLVRNALGGHKGLTPQWRAAEPKPAYDAIIIGGGGHGLAAAYYLASEHGIRNVAVLEKGWIGGGNTGRNTTLIRSNYLFSKSVAYYDHALKLWENLSQELNYNVMFSPRGVLMLVHTVHDEQVFRRHVHANRTDGIDAEWLSAAEAKAYCPPLNISPNMRYPVLGATRQRRAGVARHDAVAWGYARAAFDLGVDIIENCEVTAIRRDLTGRVSAVDTTRGTIRARKIGVSAAGNSSVVLGMAGIRLPLESFPLQALVSEPVKPAMPCIVMSNTIHAYISQSDKGELVIGAGTDAYVSYTQRGGLHVPAHTLEAICELFPMFRRLRMLRNWGGIVDTTPDRSPITAKTPVPGLYVNCGWGTGGFKATPGAGHLLDPLPHLRPPTRERVRLCRRGPSRPPRRPGRHQRRRLGRLPVRAQQRAWHPCRALAPPAWLRPLFNALRDTTTDRILTTYPAGQPRPDRATPDQPAEAGPVPAGNAA